MTEIWTRQRILQARSVDLILAERDVFTPEQYSFYLRWMVPGAMTPSEYSSRNRRGGDDSSRQGNGRGSERQSHGETPPPVPPPVPPPHRRPWYH